MKPPYRSMYGQMAYVIFSGLSLLFIPNLLLGIFGIEPAHEIWIRIMGLLVLVLSFYYYAMAKYGNDKVVIATVWGRLAFCAGLIIFVFLGMVKPALIGFALFETGLSIWSWKEIKGRN
jgi:hypothetical protein